MKKIYSLFLTGLFLILVTNVANAQLTGTKNIPGDYPTLALAITDLNVQGVGAGGVTFNVIAGNPQTAIAGGYVIGGAGSAILTGGAATSAANQVIIEGNNNTITAFAGQTAGLVNDAVFKLVGADYITLQNLTIQENPANATSTPVASNNMTEWGVALLYVSTTDGSQNNTIKNNTISLNRVYANTFGIYSSTRHTATTPGTTAEITAATGVNSPNKFYNNQVSNVNFGIVIIGSGTPAFMDNANDIGGASAATGNTITNWGGLGVTAGTYVGLTGNNLCIAAYNQNGENVSWNTITSASVSPGAISEFGILKNYAAVPTGTFTSTISNNTITINSSPTTGGITAINCQGITTFLNTATITIDNNTITTSITGNVGAAAGTFLQGILNLSLAGTVNVTNNKLLGCTINASGAGVAAATWLGISNSGACATLNVTGNIFRNGSTNTTSGQFQGIVNSGAVTTAININNNNLGDALGGCLTSTAATSGAFFGIIISASGAACTQSISNNDFRGIVYSVTSSSGVQFITSQSATARSVAENINNNTFTNLTFNTTTGNIFFIAKSNGMTATGSQIINNNSIVGSFTKSASGGTILFMQSTSAASPNGSTVSNTGNNFSNINITGTTTISAWNHQEGVSTVSGPTKTITGNTFSNITSSGTGAITILTSNTANNNSTVSSNTISNITGRGNITAISIGTFNGGAIQTYANNIISGLTSTVGGAAVISGITGGSTAVTTTNINNNTISALATAGTASFDIRGIFTTAGVTVNVFKNKLYDLSATSTGTVAALIVGNATAGTTTNIYNNYVGRCYAPSSLFYQAVTGININQTAANNNNVYYNTIYLDGSCPGQSYCVYTNSATPTLTMRNNILVNNITASGGSLFPSMVYFRTGALTATYSTASNNNIMYCGTPGASNLIYADGAVNALTNQYQTLAAFQAFVGPTRENVSKTELPPFINTTIPINNSYLHINPTIVTQAESGAVNILPYTDDYDANIRATNGGYTGSGTAPDIGADEFDVTVDNFGPEISYTLLTSSVCTTSKTFTATITDYSGVNITTGTLPRVYYKKSTNANALGATNDNTTDGWKYAEATFLGGSSFSFTIDYSLIFGGVTVADNIQYFITAQDLFSPVNVGINSGTFAATPASVALTGTAFPLTGTINNYGFVAPIPTLVTIGAAGTYTSLTGVSGFFADLNSKGLSGNTIVNIIDPLVIETGAVALNQIQAGDCSAAGYTLLIKPNAAGTVLTGSLANAALIKIKSSNVTIDGSSNGTSSRDLTITNTSIITPSVLLIGSTGSIPVTNTTAKNCVIVNGSITATALVVGDGTTLGSAGYFTNISLQNNDIQNAYVGIYAIATTVAGNGNGLNIQGNILNTVGVNAIGHVGIYVQGVDGATVSGNDIGNFESVIGEVDAGVWFATGTTNSVIEKNKIHDLQYIGSSGYGSKGIMISTGLAAANINVRNNMISGMTGDGDSYISFGAFYCPVGIYAFGAGQGGINIYYNSVHLYGATLNFAAASVSLGIALDDNTSASIKNNIIHNELGLLAANGIGAGGIGAYTSISQFTALDYNDYYSNPPLGFGFIGNIFNSFNGTLAGWQGVVGGGREANSLNVKPNFTSASDLHLVPSTNCRLDGYGTPIAGITTDYDANTRDAGAPDMGADEFTTTPAPSTMTLASNCDTKNVSPLGTLYLDGSCNLIAKILPSGGSAVAGKIKTCVTIDGSQLYFNGEPYVQRHYDIEPTTTDQTSTSATITLYFTDAEFDLYNTTNPAWPKLPTAAGGGSADPLVANVKVTQFHGVGTGSPTSPGNYPGVKLLVTPLTVLFNGTYWEVTFNVAGFSGFYVHTNLNGAPLPVVINYLNGHKQGSNHLLDWKVTCVSSPRATMTLERSSDARNYTGIYSITADAARCNSPFDYTDASPLKGMNYYRIKTIDIDGKITYSTTVALLNAVKGFDIISIAPNPVVTDNFKLNVASAQAGKMEIVIVDMQGRLVNRQSVSLIAGFNSLPVNVGNLAAGSYSMYGITGEDRSRTVRFVKQ